MTAATEGVAFAMNKILVVAFGGDGLLTYSCTYMLT